MINFGGAVLTALAGLPHVGTVAGRQDTDLVRRIVAEVSATVTRRERLFRDAGITTVEEFRARRAAGAFPDEPTTDLVLVVDGYQTLRSDFDDVEDRLLPLVTQGLSYGVHVVLTANRWTELRPAIKDLVGGRLELRLGEPSESEIDRRKAAAVPARGGHGLGPDGAATVLAAPRLHDGDTAALIARIAAATTSRVPPVRLLPDLVELADLPAPTAGAGGLPIGVDEEALALVQLDTVAEPHLVAFADAESGKTNLLRLLARGIVERFPPEQARIVVVDHRRNLFGEVADTHLIGYTSTATATAAAIEEVAESLRGRLPGADVTPRELRERSWWTGPEVYVLVDDYDLVAPSGMAAHPLLRTGRVPAAGQGRRPAPGDHPPRGRRRPGALRPGPRQAARARCPPGW